MAKPVFTSPEAKAKLEGWYRRFLAKVDSPTEERTVPTSLGPSHVLVAGNPSGSPLVVLHGSLASSGHLCAELSGFMDRFRVYAIDLPGQSVKGPEVILDVKGNALPSWIIEATDGLGLEQFDLMGVSWGGFVASRTAAFAPDRVRRLVLLVPAGFVMGSMWKGFTDAIWPILAYRRSGALKHLDRFVDSIFTTEDSDWKAFIGDAFVCYALNFAIPPSATAETFRGFARPTLVLGADKDLSFPGEKLLKRVKEIIPHAETEMIRDCKHMPPTTEEFRSWLGERVSRFLS